MTQTYYVASLKYNAWWSRSNQWHSDRSEAKAFDRAGAVVFASSQTAARAVPVRADDLV